VRIRYSPQISSSKGRDFLFMFFLYILYSKKVDRYYIGSTRSEERRVGKECTGISRSTAITEDWVVAYSESFATRQETLRRELEVKKKKSRKYIEWLIKKRQ